MAVAVSLLLRMDFELRVEGVQALDKDSSSKKLKRAKKRMSKGLDYQQDDESEADYA
jgi:hypothetical protein